MAGTFRPFAHQTHSLQSGLVVLCSLYLHGEFYNLARLERRMWGLQKQWVKQFPAWHMVSIRLFSPIVKNCSKLLCKLQLWFSHKLFARFSKLPFFFFAAQRGTAEFIFRKSHLGQIAARDHFRHFSTHNDSYSLGFSRHSQPHFILWVPCLHSLFEVFV